MKSGVFVVGSFVVDCAFRAKGLPQPGETLLGTGFALGCGGKGSNQAVAARRAGAEVSFLSAVGADAFGAMGRQLWAKEGIDAHWVRAAPVPTGAAAIVVNNTTGENAIVVVPGACGEFTQADIDAAQQDLGCASVLLVQLEVSLVAVQRALEVARAAGVITILNPAPAPLRPLPSSVLGLVDILVPNETEAERLLGQAVASKRDAADAAHALQRMGARQIIVTLGGKGAVLLDEHGVEHFIAPYDAGPVLDTTGAGDAFCGALAAALSEGKSSLAASQFASAAAGISVTRHGTASSTPARSEIDSLLQDR